MSSIGLVTYACADGIATITMDDGKANALSNDMLAAIGEAFDQATSDDAGAVLLTGRPGRFCGGFDLGVMRQGGEATVAMVSGGFELSVRMLAFPAPIVIACTGHAMAMGAFLLLSGDHRIGAEGSYKVAANEVSIGMTMPYAAIELMRQRLTPAALTRATLLSEVFDPPGAVEAGFLDRLVPADQLGTAAGEQAAQLASSLDRTAHRRSRERLRAATLEAMRAAIASDAAELGRLFG
jgi:enoyl-CoA hydratase